MRAAAEAELQEVAQTQAELIGLQREQALAVANCPHVDAHIRAAFAARVDDLGRELELNQQDPMAASERLELVTVETNLQLVRFLAASHPNEAMRAECGHLAEALRADLRAIRGEIGIAEPSLRRASGPDRCGCWLGGFSYCTSRARTSAPLVQSGCSSMASAPACALAPRFAKCPAVAPGAGRRALMTAAIKFQARCRQACPSRRPYAPHR